MTKTARTQGQTVTYYKDPFKLVPISQLAEIGDKMIRNAILTANEFRQIIGFRPSEEPGSDKLINPNMPEATQPSAIEPSRSPKSVAMEAKVLDLISSRPNASPRELKQIEASPTT